MKLQIRRDVELSDSGVEQVWVMTCPHPLCRNTGTHRITTLFWENAVRMVRPHIEYHRQDSQG